MGSSPTSGTMFNKELIQYIKNQLSSGVEKSVIKEKLVNNGWDSNTAESAIDYCAEKPRVTKKVLFGVFVFLFTLISVSGVYGYFLYTNSPKVVLSKAIQNAENVQSFSHEGEILFNLNSPDNPFGPIDEEIMINFKGSTDKKNKLSEIDFTINGDSEINGSGISLKFIDNFIYAKIIDAPEVVLAQAPFLADQWLRVDTGKVLEAADIDELKVSEDDLIRLFSKHQEDLIELFLKYRDSFSMSSSTNDDFYIYNISVIDSVGFMNFVKDVGLLIEEDLDLVEIEEFVKVIDNIDLEVWVGKEDLMFSKVVFNFDIKDDVGELKLFLSINLSDYDSIEAITTPQSFKTFDDIMSDYLLYSTDTFDILKEEKD